MLSVTRSTGVREPHRATCMLRTATFMSWMLVVAGVMPYKICVNSGKCKVCASRFPSSFGCIEHVWPF